MCAASMKMVSPIAILHCFILFMKIYYSVAIVEWKVSEKVSDFGEDLKLFCTASKYSVSSNKTKRWFGGPAPQRLLSLNGKPSDLDKYNATIELLGFGLIIKNMSENDLNVSYTCTFGFDVKSDRLLYKWEAFTVIPSDIPKEEREGKDNDTTLIIIGVLAGVLLTVAFIIFAILFWNKRRSRTNIRTPNVNSGVNSGTEEESQHLNNVNNHDLPTIQDNTPPVNITAASPDTMPSGELSEEETSLKGVFTTNATVPDKDRPPTEQMNSLETEFSSSNTSNQQTCAIDDTDANATVCSQRDGSIPDLKDYRYPSYSDEALRKKSFTNWSSSFRLNKEKLAEAGFYFLGCGFYTKCCYCGRLVDWNSGRKSLSEVSEENCKFLQQKKGLFS